MDIKSIKIGEFEGKDIVSYCIENRNGLKVKVLNFGEIITDIITPDKDGKMENIVLKYNTINNQHLYINSKEVLELDNTQGVTGSYLNIENTELDFKQNKKIGKDIKGEHL